MSLKSEWEKKNNGELGLDLERRARRVGATVGGSSHLWNTYCTPDPLPNAFYELTNLTHTI